MNRELATINEKGLDVTGYAWTAMQEQANVLVKSGFMPVAIKTAEQAIAIIMQGREVGLGPMAAIRLINIIQGKPTISSEGMLGLCYKNIPGFRAEPVEDSDKAFTIRLTRPGRQPYDSRFSLDDAKRAGLLDKAGGNWGRYPKAMLRARAISAGCRLIAPDALMGISYTPEEMGAIVDEDENIIASTDSYIDADPIDTPEISQESVLDPPEGVSMDSDDVAGDDMIAAEQVKAIHAAAGAAFGKTPAAKPVYQAWLSEQFGVGSSKELTYELASDAIKKLQKLAKERK